jgi:hypothetical protein
MPIPLNLTPDILKQLFPQAKEGDSFESSIEGTFTTDENGQLQPQIESVDGAPIDSGSDSQESQEDPAEEATETPDQEAAEPSDMPMAPDAQGPAKSPMAMAAKTDLIAKLKNIRGDKMNQGKYA